jgi:O-antigen/teichoic acid export membrane protein
LYRKLIDIFTGNIGFAYVSVAGIVNSTAGALFYLFFATLLSVNDYGKINYIISGGMVAFVLCTSGMDVVIMTYFSKKSPSILFEINSLALVISVFSAILVSIFFNNLAIGLFVVGSSLYLISFAELLAKKQYKQYLLVFGGGRIIQMILSIILYQVVGIDGFILGYAAAYLIFGYKAIINILKFTIDWRELKSLWKSILQLYGANATYQLMFYVDKIVVGALFGYYVLGSYQLAFQVFLFASFFPTSVFKYLLPHESAGKIKLTIKIFGILAAILISLIVILASPHMIYFFYPKYSQAIASIQIISLSIIPLTIANIQKVKIISEQKKIIHVLSSSIVTLITQNLLAASLGSMFGLVGISISLLIALCVQCFYLYVANRRN